jgi:hypothetical protein
MHKGGKTWGQGAPQECNTALLGSGVQVECLCSWAHQGVTLGVTGVIM